MAESAPFVERGRRQPYLFHPGPKLAGQGYDTVEANIASYTLGINLDRLVLYIGAVNGTGNTLFNELEGNGLDNKLDGCGGNDHPIGFGGNDFLIGQAGTDGLEGGTGKTP